MSNSSTILIGLLENNWYKPIVGNHTIVIDDRIIDIILKEFIEEIQ